MSTGLVHAPPGKAGGPLGHPSTVPDPPVASFWGVNPPVIAKSAIRLWAPICKNIAHLGKEEKCSGVTLDSVLGEAGEQDAGPPLTTPRP